MIGGCTNGATQTNQFNCFNEYRKSHNCSVQKPRTSQPNGQPGLESKWLSVLRKSTQSTQGPRAQTAPSSTAERPGQRTPEWDTCTFARPGVGQRRVRSGMGGSPGVKSTEAKWLEPAHTFSGSSLRLGGATQPPL